MDNGKMGGFEKRVWLYRESMEGFVSQGNNFELDLEMNRELLICYA